MRCCVHQQQKTHRPRQWIFSKQWANESSQTLHLQAKTWFCGRFVLVCSSSFPCFSLDLLFKHTVSKKQASQVFLHLCVNLSCLKVSEGNFDKSLAIITNLDYDYALCHPAAAFLPLSALRTTNCNQLIPEGSSVRFILAEPLFGYTFCDNCTFFEGPRAFCGTLTKPVILDP